MYTSHQLPPKLIVDKPNNSSSYTSYRSNHLPFTTCVPSLHAKFSLYIIAMFQETPIRASYRSNHFPSHILGSYIIVKFHKTQIRVN